MTFKTFWCGRCNRNKPIEQKAGRLICMACEMDKRRAMKLVRERREQLRKSA